MNIDKPKPKNSEGKTIILSLVVIASLFFLISGIKNIRNKTGNPQTGKVIIDTTSALDNGSGIVVDTSKVVSKITKEEYWKNLKSLKKSFRVKYDDMEEIYWIYDNSSPKFTNSNALYLYIGANKDSSWLRFRLQHYAEDWLFIEKVIFKIDDYNYELMVSPKRDNDGGMIWEWVDLGYSDTQIGTIISALKNCKSAKMRLEGSQYYRDKKITASQIAAFKRIYNLQKSLEY